jgi:hypothetical protein
VRNLAAPVVRPDPDALAVELRVEPKRDGAVRPEAGGGDEVATSIA